MVVMVGEIQVVLWIVLSVPGISVWSPFRGSYGTTRDSEPIFVLGGLELEDLHA